MLSNIRMVISKFQCILLTGIIFGLQVGLYYFLNSQSKYKSARVLFNRHQKEVQLSEDNQKTLLRNMVEYKNNMTNKRNNVEAILDELHGEKLMYKITENDTSTLTISTTLESKSSTQSLTITSSALKGTSTTTLTTTNPMNIAASSETIKFRPQIPLGYDPMAYSNFNPKVSCRPEPQLCDMSKPVVPNLVHFVWFYENVTEFPFYMLVTGLSALKFQAPEEIWFWYSDSPPVGNYWTEFVDRVNQSQTTVLRLKHTDAPTHIFGKKVIFQAHKSDIKRIEILSHYGGIYLDSDMFILRSLKPLMCYEHTQGREIEGAISNAFIMSAPGALFLQRWYDVYRKSYESEHWSFNSVITTINLWKRYPRLIHVENQCLIRPNWAELDTLLYQKGYFDFSQHYGIHLFIRFYSQSITPESIKTAPDGMSQIAFYIYYGEKRKDTLG